MWEFRKNVRGHPREEWEAAGISTIKGARAWAALGVTDPALVRQWRDVCPHSLIDVRHWLQMGVDPPGAQQWLASVISPLEARNWMALGIADPRTVGAWKQVVLSSMEARGWIEAGLDLDSVARWKQVAHVTSLVEAQAWIGLGVTDPRMVGQWKRVVLTSAEARDWIAAGLDVVSVARWKRVASSFDEVMAWRTRGVDADNCRVWKSIASSMREVDEWRTVCPTPRDAQALARHVRVDDLRRWRRRGFGSFGQIHGWASLGVRPSWAKWWQKHGMDASSAASWLAEGRSYWSWWWWHWAGADPGGARALIEMGCSALELRRWSSGGHAPTALSGWPDLATARTWTAYGFTAESAQSFLTCAGDTVAERRSLADPEVAKVWWAAGFRSASEVFVWIDEGVAPGLAADWRRVQGDDAAVAGLLKRGDLASGSDYPGTATRLDPDEALVWRSMRVPVEAAIEVRRQWPVGTAKEWTSRLGLDVRPAYEWYRSGIELDAAEAWLPITGDPRLARSMADDRIDPEAARRWRKIGIPAEQVQEWADRWQLSDAESWAQRLRIAVPAAWAWKSAPMALDEATSWRSAGFDHPDGVAEWRALGVSPAQFTDLRLVGGDTPAFVARVLETGGSLEAAVRWARLGVRKAEVFDQVRALLPLAELEAWRAKLDSSTRVVIEWYRVCDGDIELAATLHSTYGLTPAEVRTWRETFDSPTMLRWLASGVTDPSSATVWIDHGFTPASIEPWIRASLSPPDARQWLELDMVAPQAERWRSVVRSPGAARAWIEAGETDLDDVRRWVASSQTADRARKLRKVGHTPETYARLAQSIGPDRAVMAVLLERLGVGIGDGDRAWTIEIGEETIEMAVRRVVDAGEVLQRLGEADLAVHHGCPHLTPAAITAVPDARYLRGGTKAWIWGWRGSDGALLPTPAGWEERTLADDGSTTFLRMRAPVELRDALDVAMEVAGERGWL